MTPTDPGREELIARLEAATGPDREIDADIALAAGWTCHRVSGMARNWHYQFREGGLVKTCPFYTASIDAALTLVPDEHTWNAGITDEHYGGPLIATAQVLTREHTPEGWRARGVNPAIALCAAALRARSP